MLAAQVRPQAEQRRPLHALKTLVLNADYRPLAMWPPSLIPAQDAVHALFRQRVVAVEQWPDAFCRSPSMEIAVPKVVALREYAPVHGSPRFCRRSILLRDNFSCCYCGQRFSPHELTYDHVIPRAKGGATKWENIVTACVLCNARKADRLPNYSGRKAAGEMRPLRPPRQPTNAELLRAGLRFLPADVKEDFGSWLYWETELIP